jgi:aspartate/methionine/tyrosine aminotransferase
MRLSQRMARLGTETAFEVLVRARALEAQGRNIVHLEIGEPDFDTPAHIRAAANDALANGATHYGPSPGSRAARGDRRGLARRAGPRRRRRWWW